MTVRASDEERALPAHQQGGQPVKDVCADDCVISTQGLSKTFGAVNALQGLDLQVAPHSIFGFLGPNGSGKSTTIKLLLGLIRPTGGHATVFGMDSVRDSIAIRERVGYLAQDPRYYEQLTAREIMRLTAHFFLIAARRAPSNHAWLRRLTWSG